MVALGIAMRDLVARTKDKLHGPRRPPLNRLAQTLDLDSATLTLSFDASQVNEGAYLAIDDEVVYVWEKAGQVLTVQRAMRGTASDVHNEDSLVEVEPRYPNGVVLAALVDEIRSWPEDIYAVEHVTATVGRSDDAVDLVLGGTIAIHRVLSVTRSPQSNEEDWLPILGWSLRRGPTGYALAWNREFGLDADLRVTLGRAFDLDNITADTDVGDIGLTLTMLDIPPFGAAGRLLAGSEAPRLDDTPLTSSERAERVPPGTRLRAGAGYLGIRDTRLNEERRRLLALYGHGLVLR